MPTTTTHPPVVVKSRSSIRPERPVTRLQRGAALVSLAAGGLFTGLLAALHLVKPELEPTWRFVSEYALGRAGWMMTCAFISLATSLLGAVVATWRHVRTVVGRIGLVIIVVAAAGLLLAAGFETDPINTTVDAYTQAGRVHLLGASLDYSPIGMLLTGWALSRTPRWRSLRRPLMITAGISFALMVGFTATLPRDGQFGPDTYTGLMGRFLLLSYLGWIVVVGRAVRRTAQPAA